MGRICKRREILTMLLLATLASPAIAQAPGVSPPGVKGGTLGCTLSPTIGLVVGSLQRMDCRFTSDGAFPPETYVGAFGTLSLDVGITIAQGLAWAVYAPTIGPVAARSPAHMSGQAQKLEWVSAPEQTSCSAAPAGPMPSSQFLCLERRRSACLLAYQRSNCAGFHDNRMQIDSTTQSS